MIFLLLFGRFTVIRINFYFIITFQCKGLIKNYAASNKLLNMELSTRFLFVCLTFHAKK